MRRLLFVWLFALPYIAFGQVLTITDEDTGEPLELVTLVSHKPKAFTITNKRGRANINAFIGSERIEIRTLGHSTLIKTYKELQESDFELEMKAGAISMDELVISATRWNQPVGDAPVKISSISAKEVALQNPQTAADMLGASGEVFIQKSQQGGGSPMIRGFATNRLLYVVDGVRMNTAIFRSGNLQNVISLDPLAMESTEVLFGPGSVIYGSDAIGGVMNFQTLVPELSTTDELLITGKAIARYSSANDEKTAHFDVSIGGKKWAAITSISSNDYGDLKMGNYGPSEYLRPFYVQRIDSTDVIVANDDPKVQRPSGYTQMNLMQKVRYKPNKKWDVEIGHHYSETSDYGRYDRHIRYRNDLPRYGEWYYGPQKWMMNNLGVTHTGNNAVYDQVSLKVAHQYFEESRISRDFNAATREVREEEVMAYSANLDFNKSIGERHELFYGGEFVQNDVTSKGINENIVTGSTVYGPSRYPKATWTSYGGYITDQFKASEKMVLQAGARYNQNLLEAKFDTTFYPFPFTTATINNGAVTGSFGAVYRPTEKWMISANAATGFRAPNVDDAGKVFDSEPGSVVVPNPNLEAEYAYNGDLAIAKIFGDWLKIDATGYYTLLENAMVRRDYTLNGMDSIVYDGILSQVQAIQNAAATTVFGVQAGFELKLPAGFGLSSRFNYQKGEEELDDGSVSPSRHAPPWFGVTRLTYKAEKLSMQLYSMFNGERPFSEMPEDEKGKAYLYAKDGNGNPYSPGWVTLNYKAMYQFLESFAVSAGVENIANVRYRPYSSGLVAAGRNFILSLRASF